MLLREQALVALSIHDREAILRTLVDSPTALTELRAVLLQEHERRVRKGSCTWFVEEARGDDSESLRRSSGLRTGNSRRAGEPGAALPMGHFRFCRCQYHHMHHASRAQTSQGARNITGWASRPHAAGHVTRIIGRQQDEGRAICGSRSGN